MSVDQPRALEPYRALDPAEFDVIVSEWDAHRPHVHEVLGDQLGPALVDLWLGLETVEPYEAADAPLYEYLLGPFSADVQAWVKLARHTGGPVLDVGCGAGRLAVPIVEAGLPVDALDRNLAQLRRRVPGSGWLGGRLTAVPADLNQLGELRGGYRLIALAGSVITAISAPRRVAVLRRLADALHPDGLLVLDYHGIDPHHRTDQRYAFRVPRFDHISQIAVVHRHLHHAQSAETIAYYSEERTGGGHIRRRTSMTTKHLVDESAVPHLLANAGLAIAGTERRTLHTGYDSVLLTCRRS